MPVVTALSPSESQAIELWHRSLLEQDFGLINPLQVEASFWSDLPTTPVVPNGLESRTRLMPRLVALRAMTREARVELLDRMVQHERHSKRPLFSALIVATHASNPMAKPLASRLAVKDPEGDTALLRYYDPSVFAHLRWLLTDEQLSRLLRGIQTWTWRDANGQWQQTRPPHQAALSQFRLTREQWDTLRRLGLINRCLKNLAKKDEDIDGTNVQTAQTVDALLKQAYERHGLTDRDERSLYVEQAMRFDRDIHRHPELIKRLEQSRNGADYVGACADLDDDAMLWLVETLHHPEKATP